MSDKAVTWLMDRADKLGGFIDELAKQLGVAATHVYEVLVKQQMVDGISLLVKAGVWLAILILLWTLMNKLVFKKWSNFYNDDPYGFDAQFALGVVTVLLAVVTIFFSFYIVDWLTLGIKKLLNPEYYALEDIMTFIKGQVDKK
ncbi:membrane protein [Bacillus phage Bcp1]|uniref:Putative membrane protein n=1 Tax=Bacillus phage Bcp1 TaxID=584892 RepID=X2JKY6_9CAUD|nr:membrane protein [Bacillus phage Bcp1]AHN66480.1 putative membrane protein [Bacillus phage Bcp1]